jgi:hypothetical protein
MTSNTVPVFDVVTSGKKRTSVTLTHAQKRVTPAHELLRDALSLTVE